MAINKTIELDWNGKPYKVRVTMGLIDRIEEDLNLFKMVGQARKGDLRFSHIAMLFSHLLTSAGCEVTQEEVYQGMFGNGGVSAKDAGRVVGDVLMAIFPEPPKKPEAKPKRKTTTRKRATRGKTTTK